MKKGLLKRLSAVALAAVLAVSLVPLMGTVTNGAVGPVEAKATEEIRVTAETVRQFKQNVEVFKAGGLSGETLYEQVMSVTDDEEIVSEINAVYESYTTSKNQLIESLHEYSYYILQTADYYDTVLQQQQITSIIKLIKSLTKSVTLSVSSSNIEIMISVDELRAYGNLLRERTDGLEQGHSAEEIKALFESHLGWFEQDEINSTIEERFAQYIADREAYAQILSEILDWYCYYLQQEDSDDPFIVTDDPVDYGLDIPKKTQTIDPESGETVSSTTWDCIWFGNYPPSGSWGYGTDPIKWRVLWVDGDNAFLLSDKNLDTKVYNESGSGAATINWSTCTLRAWLNEDFYNTAFNEEERSAVRTTIVNNENNPEYGIYGGGATFDKIYLLSVSEALNPNYGFPSTDSGSFRAEWKVENSAYTKSKDYTSPSGSIDFWWLRTIGYGSGYAIRMRNAGAIATMKGYYTWSAGMAVRPCLHIDLSKEVWTYAGTVCSDGTVQEVSSHTHVWDDEYTIDKEATCIEEGSKSIHCSACGEIKEGSETVIPKTDHTFGDWMITKAPSCTEAGIREKACTVCGGTVSEELPATEHNWNDNYTVDKEPTCIEEGVESIHCSVCDEIKTDSSRAIAKTAHSYEDWTIKIKPTYEEVGIKERECTICGHTEQAEIPILEKKGWIKEDGYWYYYNADGTKAINTWKKDSKGWCYLSTDGKMVTNGWAKDSKGWCWIGDQGYMVEQTKWIKVGNDWYHITNGYRDQSKWMKDSKGWCYLGADGKMVTNGWAKDSKGWCWMGSDGYWVKNKWIKSGGYWYYLKSDGYMATGTLTISGKTYKFDSSGRWIS